MKKCIFLILAFVFTSTTLFSQSKIDSLENALKKVSDKEKLVILEELIQSYSKTSTQKEMEYAELGLTIAKKMNLQKEIALYTKFVGHAFFSKGDYDQTFIFYYEALRIYEQLNDTEKYARTAQTIGAVLFELARFDEALKYYEEAYEIMERLGNKRLMAKISQNIATAHVQKDRDFAKALEYYLQTLKLLKEIGPESDIYYLISNIGYIYILIGEYSKALEYFEEALPLAQEMNDKKITALIFRNIAMSYKGNGDYKQAIEYFEKCIESCKDDFPVFKMSCYSELSKIYLETHDYLKAYESAMQRVTLKDSMFTLESEERIAGIQTKYETEKKEQQIVLLEKDKTISGMKLKRQRSLLLYLTGGIVMIFLFVLILSNLYRQKVKTAAALAVANGKLEELSRTDPLTKLWNRRYLHEIIELERTRIKRAFEPFSFILMDIDHFKNVNDTYGHECGDYVLATMAVILRSAVRKQDLVGRWGGEEFLLFLPKTSLKGAITIAESVRKKIEDYPFSYSSKTIPVTATLGVSQFEKLLSVDECIKLSDDALYEGKESGRNRVVSVQEEDN